MPVEHTNVVHTGTNCTETKAQWLSASITTGITNKHHMVDSWKEAKFVCKRWNILSYHTQYLCLSGQ